MVTYLPEDPQNPGFLDRNETGSAFSLSHMRNLLTQFNITAAEKLTEGSIYHGYKRPDSPPAIQYVFHETSSEYREKLPRGRVLNAEKGTYRPDYMRILERENICDLVDNKGVRQVWLWGYHHGEIEPTESNMAMGTISKKYWTHGTYGDISNSEKTNDLPTCKYTYVVYNYNMTRAVGEMLEDHSHQFERVFNHLDLVFDHTTPNRDDDVFWGKFVGAGTGARIKNPGCGWTHYPPNGVKDYDWYNQTLVESDCMDWKPDGGGKKSQVNCQTWADDPTCSEDGGTAFKVWWYQNMPGLQNGLSYRGRPLRNWWEAIYDLDTVLAQETGLYMPPGAEINSAEVRDTSCLFTTDFNDSGSVDIFDYSRVLESIAQGTFATLLDVNCDGSITILDLQYLIDKFGE